MKVLVVGYSRIARRRVIPALKSLPEVSEVLIVSRSAKRDELDATMRLFDDYERAFAESNADLAYISLANSDHARWSEMALRRGMHVVVDKPAFTTLADAQRLVDCARANRRCIAEATVFAFHPQIQIANRVFDEADARPTRVTAIFSFPPLAPSDFRYRSDLGGGCIFDVGPYAVATSRIFFGHRPRRITCEVLTRNGAEGVETAFSVLLTYSEGRALVGHFGFDTEYQNHLILLGSGVAVDMNRAFTLPADQANSIVVRRSNSQEEITVPAADAFAIFLGEVLDSIAKGDWSRFEHDLLEDAELLGELRKATGTY